MSKEERKLRELYEILPGFEAGYYPPEWVGLEGEDETGKFERE